MGTLDMFRRASTFWEKHFANESTKSNEANRDNNDETHHQNNPIETVDDRDGAADKDNANAENVEGYYWDSDENLATTRQELTNMDQQGTAATEILNENGIYLLQEFRF